MEVVDTDSWGHKLANRFLSGAWHPHSPVWGVKLTIYAKFEPGNYLASDYTVIWVATVP